MVEARRIELRSTIHDREASPGSVISEFSAGALPDDTRCVVHGGSGYKQHHTAYVCCSSPLSGALPMTGTLIGSASLHYLGSEGVIIVDVYASVPLFYETRRSRPASSVKPIVSKPVAPIRMRKFDLSKYIRARFARLTILPASATSTPSLPCLLAKARDKTRKRGYCRGGRSRSARSISRF